MNENISASDAQADLPGVIKRAQRDKDRLVLVSGGKQVAAVVPMEDLKLIEQLEDRADLDAANKARTEKGEVAWEQLKSEKPRKRP